jgi:hypothetical protein
MLMFIEIFKDKNVQKEAGCSEFEVYPIEFE